MVGHFLLALVIFSGRMLAESSQNFIVTFYKYFPSSTRHLLLYPVLQPTYLNYSITKRVYSNNVSIDISDFDVITIRNLSTYANDFFNRFKTARLIKYAYADNIIIQRSLKSELKDKQNPAVSDAVPGSVPLDKIAQPWLLLSAAKAWESNICGQGVRVGIFDTGLVDTSFHRHFRTIVVRERTNWTYRTSPSDDTSNDDNPAAIDGHGHGTFITGVIGASPDEDTLKWAQTATNASQWNRPGGVCPPPGLAPQADIGGPDFRDQPFVDKVKELTANGILLVSAIGNNGPLFGTLNNPADQMEVLGVGGVDAFGYTAKFSSRGLTAWEFEDGGYGRIKPDISTWATDVIGSGLDGSCTTLSGTSVASPIVTGVVALLISAALSRYPQPPNASIVDQGTLTGSACLSCPPVNPASLKQAIIAGATPATSQAASSIFEQGAGMLNLTASLEIIQRLRPQATLWPSFIDLTNCPYMWPYCTQPIYVSGQPIIVNVTILNSMAVSGRILDKPVYHPILNKNGHLLNIGVTFSQDLNSWVGYLAVHISVHPGLLAEDTRVEASQFVGTAEGWISLKIVSPSMIYDHPDMWTDLKLPIRVKIIPTPPRSKRILWDHFHNIRYPPAYVPRDDLTQMDNLLDWLGDHMHTNFRDLYHHLRSAGYFIELLQHPFTCFDAELYGTLLIVDSEDEFHPEEVQKLRENVLKEGLSLILFAGWYNTSVQDTLRFYDANNRRSWNPITGGANIPAINDLLRPFGIQFGDTVLSGKFGAGNHSTVFSSGVNIAAFPADSRSSIHSKVPGGAIAVQDGFSRVLQLPLADLGAQFIQQQTKLVHENAADTSFDARQKRILRNIRLKIDESIQYPVLGVRKPFGARAGKIAVFGDSTCLDSTHVKKNCFWLLDALLGFVNSEPLPDIIAKKLKPPEGWLTLRRIQRLRRSSDSRMSVVSRVMAKRGGGSLNDTFQRLRGCPFVEATLTAPLRLLRDINYGPQRLLLSPPIVSEANSRFTDPSQLWCHSRLPVHAISVDHEPFGVVVSMHRLLVQIIFEYSLFFIVAMLVILVVLRRRIRSFASCTLICGILQAFRKSRSESPTTSLLDDTGYLADISFLHHQEGTRVLRQQHRITEKFMRTLPHRVWDRITYWIWHRHPRR